MKFAQSISFKPAILHQLVCFVVLTFALLSHASQVQAQVMEKGLVSYWSFDKADVEGKIVKDVGIDELNKLWGQAKLIELK